MALDTDKIDEAVLALLYLTLHDHWRAWKGFDWDALNRLYEKDLIGDGSHTRLVVNVARFDQRVQAKLARS